ncbi:MAG: ATPase, T2SS/T4P/T4SS family [Actinomycetota bacterium]|jgi:type IV pilus assembly protein PilB|nr:ATPase, T2SS/T4P/T4SS family [Actinomycetota bacterium]
MADSNTITGRVLDALVGSGLLTADQVATVRDAATAAGTTVGAVIADRGWVLTSDLAIVLERELGIPTVDLTSYAPDDEALQLIPPSLARDRNILPLFEIEGMLTVAIGSAMDVFTLDELASHLGMEIEAVLGDAQSVRDAISVYYVGVDDAASVAPASEYMSTADLLAEEPVLEVGDLFEVPGDATPVVAEPLIVEDAPSPNEDVPAFQVETIEQVVETKVEQGTAAIDLDVLAVADTAKVAILVAEILEHAVHKGANRIHLLPYKDDFFLVFRVSGRLEKVASAPLSMQGPLVDGFKNFAKLTSVPSSLPALGRVKSHIADNDLILTVSAVPTVAGQRLVVSLASAKPEPRTLTDLGMTEAESRALHAMVERGRGLLLVAGPVAGGRSQTYYSLLAHAAAVGKTVYSVEQSVEYEIPAVAQVLVSPGSSVGSEAYFAAGISQDTDIIAIDTMQSVEDVHLAIEAAGLGKLVIATFSGGGIVSAVRRMLDLGAEPNSLASALTLGVGQRLARINCPNCSQERVVSLSDSIPGASKGMTTRAGTGCPNCGKSGFRGATGIFEVLPFTEPVRAMIARGASAEDIAGAAHSAGMRPMIASGLARVAEGLVSPEELNRVLRFSE